MASEYHKWIARNEKPREERVLTKEEKWENWWNYHRNAVFAWLAVLALAVWFAVSVFTGAVEAPDYCIAYIGSRALPADTVSALESALAPYGVDLSGDGAVKVQVIQYVIGDDADYYTEIKLMTDFASGTSPFFLCEDPQSIQKIYEAFSYVDGTYPSQETALTEKLWYAWNECLGLAGLELGDYSLDPADSLDVIEVATGSNQELLSGLYVSRRGPWEKLEESHAAEYTRMYRMFLYGMEKADQAGEPG